MAILDEFPFPWHKPEAQQLQKTMVQLYPSSSQAKYIALQVNIDVYVVYLEQAPDLLWVELINQAANQGLLRVLTERVLEIIGPKSPYRPFLADLLVDQEPVLAAEPQQRNGSIFNNGSDDITEPEALLFHDDLSLQIGKIPGLIKTLQLLLGLAPAVCKLWVDFGGSQFAGTGFRIGPRLLLTNWHVLHHPTTDAEPKAVSAQFGFEDDQSGELQLGTSYPCDCATIIGESSDDWSVIETKNDLAMEITMIALSAHAEPQIDGAAFIIQHPQGVSKRVAFVRNLITDITPETVHYLTDTQQGSSGAPVFNADGQLIALHRAGGNPQSIAGGQPIVKNEGVRIPLILEALQEEGKFA